MKNSLKGLNSRCELEKERTDKLKGRSIKIIQSKELKEKRMKNKEPQRPMGHQTSILTWESQEERRERS